MSATLDRMPHLGGEPLHGLLLADDGDDVTGHGNAVIGRDVNDAWMAGGVAAHDAGEDDVVVVLVGQDSEVGQSGRLDADGRSVQLGRQRVFDDGREGLVRGRHPQPDRGGEQHAEHAEQVRHRVADGRAGRRPRPRWRRPARGCWSARRRRCPTGSGPRGRVSALPSTVTTAPSRRPPITTPRARPPVFMAAKNDGPAPTPMTYAKTARPKVPRMTRQLEAVVVRREGQRGEQHRGRAEGEAADLDGPDRPADREDDHQQQQWLLGGDIGVLLQDLAHVHGIHYCGSTPANAYVTGVTSLTRPCIARPPARQPAVPASWPSRTSP